MKKLISITLVVLMMLTAIIPTLAVGVTVNDSNGVLTGHTFKAYQILKGDHDTVTNTLSNISWGDGIDYVDLVAELKSDSYDAVFANAFDALDSGSVNCASELASILATFSDTSAQIEKFIDIAIKHLSASHGVVIDTTLGAELADGYYVIVDTTNVEGKDEVANAALLQVVGEDVVINAKVEKPTLEKKVKENNSYSNDDGYGAGYNDVATYSIGDTIPFALYTTVPNITQYDSYEMSFHDVMSKGLELDESSFVVTIGGVEIVKGTTSGGVHTGDYHVVVTKIDVSNETAETPVGNTVFSLHIPDLKTIKIDDGAGGTRSVAQGDKIVVSYNATLDKDAVVGIPGETNTAYLEYTNNPDIGGNGKTPKDKVIVFTLGLELDKVDGANTDIKLKGVEFVLWKDTAKTAFAVTDANGVFNGWVEVSSLTDTNSDSVVDPYDYVSATDKAIFVTDVDGNVTVKGLDDGTYYAEETKELAGYNALVGLITITVSSNTANGQSWDFVPENALTGLLGDTDSDWLVEKQIVNNGGTVLPETGGIGTLIFVAVGCSLVIGTCVVMVTRKKMSVYED